MAFLVVASFVLMFAGFFAYNPVRRKWAGIIGVGGSYVVLLGVMTLVMLIGSMVRRIAGTSISSAGIGETIGTVLVMLVCLAYMVYVILTRCSTVAQRIKLPFVACLIGYGFCLRFLAAIVFHVPMESGSTRQEEANFPSLIRDPNGEQYRCLGVYGDHAEYCCDKTGQRVTFNRAVLDDGFPNGWERL